MLDARCTYGDRSVVYSIFTFMQLAESDIERYRQHLLCLRCGAKAYYRKQSIDGKSACFGSRYHKEDCDEARLSSQSLKEESDSAEVNSLIQKNNLIVLDYYARPLGRHDSHKKASPKADSASAAIKAQLILEDKVEVLEKEHQSDTVSRLGMEKLLNSLLRGSNLAQADTLVEIDAGYQFKAKNLFVNFADALPSDSIKAAKPKMYWGTLSHTDTEMNWLNPADCQDLGIPLGRHKQALLTQFAIKDRQALEGAGVMLFGKCFWNKDKTRKIIELWSPERVFFSLVKDEE